MRIPLDYYRILSVPVKATPEQLKQAYGDRLLQQPRREYSETAIESRQELIRYSYQVLADSEQRATYDGQFLLNMQALVTTPEMEESEIIEGSEPESQQDVAPATLANPTIEIPSGQLIGALLILHELGEYETVLSLGIDYFNELAAALPLESEPVILDTSQEDLILSLALAYLELGREQWHRQEYEHAAISGQMGIDLLEQKSLFPHLQTELERDLYRLRPYRILELISHNPVQSQGRKQGFQLLQSMLLQRQGIEGRGEDHSGLNFDQFLCFVQQLRTYLTSAEQQQLFDDERQSNSAIANYLAVYALLGRGFSLKQPELVIRAQRKLDYLAEQQDVSWEQAIAALLLGHTEKAIAKLKQASDPSKLLEIQRHTINSSDLLPGLCFYGEQWLQQDVISQFQDLASIELTLKEYFADWQVQSFLEELAPPTMAEMTPVAQPAVNSSTPTTDTTSESLGLMSLWRSLFATDKSAATPSATSSLATEDERELVGATLSREHYTSSTAIIEREQTQATTRFSPSNRRMVSPPKKNQPPKSPPRKSPTLPLESKTNYRAVPPRVIAKAQGQMNRKKATRRQKRSAATLWQGWLFIFGLIFGVGAIGFGVTKLLLSNRPQIAAQPQLAIALSQPIVEIPAPKPPVAEPKKPQPQVTFGEQSQQVVQTWLTSKAAAFGQEHQIEQLNKILAEPLLTVWRERAKAYQQENLYREYQHQVTLRSAKINPQNPNQATVEAQVKEVAQHYQAGKLDQQQSYNDNLLVRYQLIRKGEKWLISQAEVLQTLEPTE